MRSSMVERGNRILIKTLDMGDLVEIVISDTGFRYKKRESKACVR